jgi:hypothetical protein
MLPTGKVGTAYPGDRIYDQEQREILKIIDETTRTEKRKTTRQTRARRPAVRWHKFNGDVVCRVVAKFLENPLKNCDLKAVGPHVFVDDFPDEFDLLIVDSDADPSSEYTNSYAGGKVRLVLEVKKRGAIGNRKEFKRRLRRIRRTFKSLAATLHTSCAYLTIEETYKDEEKAKSKRSRKGRRIYYLEETKKILESKGFQVFCLRHSHSKDLKENEWNMIVEMVQQLRRPHAA